jgi:hypothetical protein
MPKEAVSAILTRDAKGGGRAEKSALTSRLSLHSWLKGPGKQWVTTVRQQSLEARAGLPGFEF